LKLNECEALSISEAAGLGQNQEKVVQDEIPAKSPLAIHLNI